MTELPLSPHALSCHYYTNPHKVILVNSHWKSNSVSAPKSKQEDKAKHGCKQWQTVRERESLFFLISQIHILYQNSHFSPEYSYPHRQNLTKTNGFVPKPVKSKEKPRWENKNKTKTKPCRKHPPENPILSREALRLYLHWSLWLTQSKSLYRNGNRFVSSSRSSTRV